MPWTIPARPVQGSTSAWDVLLEAIFQSNKTFVDGLEAASVLPNWWPGQWGIPGASLRGEEGFTLAAGTMYFVPFRLTAPGTLNGMGVAVKTPSGTGGATARLGVWGMNAAGLVGSHTRLLDAGTVAIDSGGAKSLTPSLALNPGRYLASITPSAAGCTVSGYLSSDFFGLDRIDASDFVTKSTLEGAFAFGALPANFTPGWSGAWHSGVGSAAPLTLKFA